MSTHSAPQKVSTRLNGTRELKITRLKRVMNSPEGNPRWVVDFSDRTYARTVVNADVNYGIESFRDRWVAVDFNKGQVADVRELPFD